MGDFHTTPGDLKGTVKCGRANCKTCKSIPRNRSAVTADNFTNGRSMYLQNTNVTNCASSNLVYYIYCDECGIGYVGETKQKLSARMNGHRSAIAHQNKSSHMVNHFSQHQNWEEHFKVVVLETMGVDSSAHHRRVREDFYIRLLNTAFPWGLNEKIDGYGNIDEGINPFNIDQQGPWFCFGSERQMRTKRKDKRFSKKADAAPVIDDNVLAIKNPTLTMQALYKLVTNIGKKSLDRIVYIVMNQPDTVNELQKLQILTFAKAKYYSSKKTKKNDKEVNWVHQDYVNKWTDIIKMRGILKNPKVWDGTNVTNKIYSKISPYYTYSDTLRQVVHNYSGFLKKLDENEIMKLMKSNCACQESQYVYDKSNHVITGDCKIVNNRSLSLILKKGANHRTGKSGVMEEAKLKSFLNAMEIIFTLIKRRKIDIGGAGTAYDRIRKCLVDKWNQIEQRNKGTKKCDTWSNYQVKKALKGIHENFVVTGADKASNNFIFTCKKHYVEVMCKELGVRREGERIIVEGNNTYEPAGIDEDTIYRKFNVYNQRWLQTETEEAEKILPRLFALPKLHKDPYKWRFIANGRVSPWKRLSLVATAILAKFIDHLEKYCATVKRSSGVNRFWNIKNTSKILSLLRSGKQLNSVHSADFSTLYTNFPHDLILNKLYSLTDMLMKHSGEKFVSVSCNGAYYHSNEKAKLKYNVDEIKFLLQANIENAYVTFGQNIFRQKSGIVMGSSCSPAMATAALSWMEYEWCKERLNVNMARRMNYTFRYIDDIITFNNKDLRDQWMNIYPACLPLQFTNDTETTTNYMDLRISLGTRANSTLYDKRKDFNFDISRYIDDNSNVPLTAKLNVFYGQLLRIIRICDTKKDFEKNAIDLITSFLEKGINTKNILGTALKLTRRYKGLLLKYGVRGKRSTEGYVRRQIFAGITTHKRK